MKKITILHNPRCSKSREALAIIKEVGAEVEIREYLKDPLTAVELKKLLAKLGLEAEELVRKGEDVFKTRLKGLKLTEKEWLHIIAENPQLLERPVVFTDTAGIIGRPPEKVKEFLENKR